MFAVGGQNPRSFTTSDRFARNGTNSRGSPGPDRVDARDGPPPRPPDQSAIPTGTTGRRVTRSDADRSMRRPARHRTTPTRAHRSGQDAVHSPGSVGRPDRTEGGERNSTDEFGHLPPIRTIDEVHHHYTVRCTSNPCISPAGIVAGTWKTAPSSGPITERSPPPGFPSRITDAATGNRTTVHSRGRESRQIRASHRRRNMIFTTTEVTSTARPSALRVVAGDQKSAPVGPGR